MGPTRDGLPATLSDGDTCRGPRRGMCGHWRWHTILTAEQCTHSISHTYATAEPCCHMVEQAGVRQKGGGAHGQGCSVLWREGAKLPGIPESCAGGSDANPKNRLPAVGPGLVSRLPTMGSCLVSWAMGCGVWSCIPAAGRGVRFRIPGCHTWGQVWHPGLRVAGSRLASLLQRRGGRWTS